MIHRGVDGPLRARAAGWLLAGALLLSLAPAGAQPAAPAPAPKTPPAPPEKSDAAAAPAQDAAQMRREAEILERENRALRERAAQLEQDAQRRQGLQARLEQLRGAHDPAQDESEARRLALAAALQDFFVTAGLVDQALEQAQTKSTALRRQGVFLSSMPEIGHLQTQLRMLRLVRDYLRGQTSIAGVPLAEVDQPVATRELADGLSTQNALYLNSYALERLRSAADQPGFPTALRALLHSSRLIHEMPSAPQFAPSPSGLLPETPLGPTQPTPQPQTRPQLPPGLSLPPGLQLPPGLSQPPGPVRIAPRTTPVPPGAGRP